jgi:hypothetical protein
MTRLYRNYNGGHILANVNPDGQHGMVFLGTVERVEYDGRMSRNYAQAQHAPAYLLPTANELRYYGVE